MTDTNTTCTLTETKVFNLCKEVDDMKRRKKAFVKEYNAEIKFLQQEINELLNPQEKVELPWVRSGSESSWSVQVQNIYS